MRLAAEQDLQETRGWVLAKDETASGKKSSNGPAVARGMSLGAGVGAALGAGLGVALGSIAIGAGAGVALGAAIGMTLAMSKK